MFSNDILSSKIDTKAVTEKSVRNLNLNFKFLFNRNFTPTAPSLHTWAGLRVEGEYVLEPQEAISEAGRLGGCRLYILESCNRIHHEPFT